jgi:uncharacterized membrane protein YfcA
LNLDLLHATVIFVVGFIAGAMNSVAGGGTLLTFPALIWVGLSSVTANATSTIAVWPGIVGTIWGYRRELRCSKPRMLWLVVPSLIGGLTGAALLRRTPNGVFDAIVPLLLLFATVLLMANEPIQRLLKKDRPSQWFAAAVVFQFLVAIYGGYFGAGIGILMLAAMSLLGMTDIHEMNALRALYGGCINGIAAAYFVGMKMVYWPFFVVMVLGTIAGGYGGVVFARRLGARAVRRIAIAIGLAMTVSLAVKLF